MKLLMLMRKFLTGLLLCGAIVSAYGDVWDEVSHGYADNNGVKIHYATTGTGPLVIMIHGFPDFWYSWRHQMEGLSEIFKSLQWISGDTISAINLREKKAITWNIWSQTWLR